MSEEVEQVTPIASEEKKGLWYVIRVLSGYERKIRDAIMRQTESGDSINVYETYVPVEKVATVKQGKKSFRDRLIFPGYVFVRMDLFKEDGSIDESTWYAVRGIQGVLGFPANHPHALSEEEAKSIICPAEDENGEVKPNIEFNVGEIVRISDGAFEGLEGEVREVDYVRGKLKLAVTIFGRSTPVELEFWQVEKTV